MGQDFRIKYTKQDFYEDLVNAKKTFLEKEVERVSLLEEISKDAEKDIIVRGGMQIPLGVFWGCRGRDSRYGVYVNLLKIVYLELLLRVQDPEIEWRCPVAFAIYGAAGLGAVIGCYIIGKQFDSIWKTEKEWIKNKSGIGKALDDRVLDKR